MTKFNPENKEKLNYGECLGPAMAITDQADADQYLKDYKAFIQKSLDVEPNPKGLTAEQIALSNLGYYAGYYDEKVRRRVERLFRTAHPVFGSIEAKGAPTTEQAFTAGFNAGSKLR